MNKEKSKGTIKTFWDKHKKKILIIGSVAAGCVTVGLITRRGKEVLDSISIDFGDFKAGSCAKQNGIDIPDMSGMKCLDIAPDGDGKVVWLSDCTLKQMGELGENLCKIEGLDPDMVTTMVIVGKENIQNVKVATF